MKKYFSKSCARRLGKPPRMICDLWTRLKYGKLESTCTMHAIKRDRGKPICNEKVLLSFLLPCFRRKNIWGKTYRFEKGASAETSSLLPSALISTLSPRLPVLPSTFTRWSMKASKLATSRISSSAGAVQSMVNFLISFFLVGGIFIVFQSRCLLKAKVKENEIGKKEEAVYTDC